MGFWEVLLTAIALSMDAAAVGMSNGMCQKKIKASHALLTGGLLVAFLLVFIYFGEGRKGEQSGIQRL